MNFKSFPGMGDQEYVDKKIDYVCFTNNTELTSDIWHMVNIDVADGEYRRYARKLKMSPHILFPQYETSIWVDAKFLINSFISIIIQFKKQLLKVMVWRCRGRKKGKHERI